MQITEANFLIKAKQQDERALEYIISQYGWVMKTVVDKHLYHLEAYKEECINDTLLGIWQNIDRFDPDKSSFQNWVAGVARFKALTYVRKYIKEVAHTSIEDEVLTEEDTTAKVALEEEQRQFIETMLTSLKEKDQLLFKKIYLEEQDIDEVSREMDMHRDVIYNRMSRGKKKLQQLFGNAYKKQNERNGER